MGVPQTRHRVFFVAVRNDISYDFDSLDMFFNYEPVLFEQICSEKGRMINQKSKVFELIKNVKCGETDLSDACERLYGKGSFFNEKIIYKNKVLPTIRAKSPSYYRFEENTGITRDEIIKASTFPLDYDFGSDSINVANYICGMSVPPIMIKRIVTRLIESGVFDYKLKQDNEK